MIYKIENCCVTETIIIDGRVSITDYLKRLNEVIDKLNFGIFEDLEGRKFEARVLSKSEISERFEDFVTQCISTRVLNMTITYDYEPIVTK